MALLEPQPIPPLTAYGRTHFIMIGGAGMSGIARLFAAFGVPVGGSDTANSPFLDGLTESGIVWCDSYRGEHVAEADTVVLSSAVRPDNPELIEAQRLGLRIVHRSVALASVMREYPVRIAITGTHGKSTTTAMTVAALQGAGINPGYALGATLSDGTGAAVGDRQVFVAEADESDGSFRQLPATIAVITNIEPDHLDNWETPQRYAAGFAEFALGLGDNAQIVLGADDPGTQNLRAELPRQVTTFGEAPGDWQLANIRARAGGSTATLSWTGGSAQLQLQVPGRHNLRNAAAAVAAAVAAGSQPQPAVAGLRNFTGTARRFQLVGAGGGAQVYDDYAHHPTEVRVTLEAGRELAAGRRLVVGFQPHLYSRTRDFATEFGRALALAEVVVVLPIYAAREDPLPGVSGAQVAAAARAAGAAEVHYVWERGQAVELLAGLVKPGDLVILAGAGDINQLGPQLVCRLSEGAK